MTISTSTALVTIQGNGATTVFNFSFIIPYLSDGITPAVNVYYTDTSGSVTLLSPSNYIISGVGNPAGGSVTYNPLGVPIPIGSYLTIARAVPYTQPTSVPNQSFFPNTLEAVADNLEMQIQQLLAEDSFVMRAPITDPSALNPIPGAKQRANAALGFDINGQPIAIAFGGSAISGLLVARLTFSNSPYTIGPGGANCLFIDCGGGNFVANLPVASTIESLMITRVDESVNTLTLAAAGGNTIQGNATKILASGHQSVILIPNGATDWGVF